MKKILIIGGGASGLMCAIRLKQINSQFAITIIEKNSRIGQKILKTGNGRCNISNLDMTAVYYNHPEFMDKCLKKHNVSDIVDFFCHLGLLIKTDGSTRLYPYSESAVSVLEILRRQIDKMDIEVRCNTIVSKIMKNNKFHIHVGSERIDADYVVLAAGSVAQNNSDSYALVKNFNHKIIKVRPGLVPLKTGSKLKSLRGIRVKCMASVLKKNKIVHREYGEILFKDDGLSGVLALNLSRYADNGSKIFLDFIHDVDESDLNVIFNNFSLKEALIGILPKMLAMDIYKKVAYKNINDILYALRNYQLDVIGTYGFHQAQIALGGVDIKEINDDFSSKLIENLYIIGEMLDIDGACGGYNLHFAWISGMIAAESIGF